MKVWNPRTFTWHRKNMSRESNNSVWWYLVACFMLRPKLAVSKPGNARFNFTGTQSNWSILEHIGAHGRTPKTGCFSNRNAPSFGRSLPHLAGQLTCLPSQKPCATCQVETSLWIQQFAIENGYGNSRSIMENQLYKFQGMMGNHRSWKLNLLGKPSANGYFSIAHIKLSNYQIIKGHSSS